MAGAAFLVYCAALSAALPVQAFLAGVAATTDPVSLFITALLVASPRV
jgi:hypothetical protein